MTTYILHGGYYKRDTQDNKKFFKAITDRLSDQSRILFVAYAREKREWQIKRDEIADQIDGISPDKKLTIVLASEKTDDFIEQIKTSEAIFLAGGKPEPLHNYLHKVPDLEKLWKDKLIVGSSAGVWVLSKYYCLWKSDDICEGLGILPIKSLVHWTEDQSDKLRKLEAYAEKLDLLKIPEEKFLVVTR